MDEKRTHKNKKPVIINVKHSVSSNGDYLTISAACLTKLLNSSSEKLDTKNIKIKISDDNIVTPKFKYSKGIPFIQGYRINSYNFKISLEKIEELDIQNKLTVLYPDSDSGRILYNAFDLRTGKHRHSQVYRKNDLIYYIRQSIYNGMYLTVREENFFDTDEGKERLDKAYKNAGSLDVSDIILMYEKECNQYEESASVLYEKLIDRGYNNVYYILDKSNPVYEKIDEKYKKNIIDKFSDEHLEKFFACKTFIGTETIWHAIQLRAIDKRIVNKIYNTDLTHVFLQHGVMYMISLDADARIGFRESGLKKYRVVVSSQKEANHFMELGGLSKDELYITGLAKFDKSILDDNADRIVIMPTWRRWEVNEAKKDITETGYYKLIKKIIKAIPDELRDKVIILPHPLMKKYINTCDEGIKPYIWKSTHDEALKRCKLLITDYSSISYDAFYRGSNVILYWEEKDECLRYYGNAHLMIDDETAFGRVCYDEIELSKVITAEYNSNQSEEDINKFTKIVEFHDGYNSDRIIVKLIEDNIIH